MEGGGGGGWTAFSPAVAVENVDKCKCGKRREVAGTRGGRATIGRADNQAFRTAAITAKCRGMSSCIEKEILVYFW